MLKYPIGISPRGNTTPGNRIVSFLFTHAFSRLVFSLKILIEYLFYRIVNPETSLDMKNSDQRRRLSIRSRISIFLLSGLCLFGTAAARDQDETKSPAFRLSISHRIRFVTWDNAIHLDEDAGSASTFNRHRTSLGLRFTPSQRWEAVLKVTNEFRIYHKPKGREFNINEFFVDNFYIKGKPFSIPLTITAGRQNIMLGEGFVVMDGHPLDGSRSIYFNALRMDFSPARGHNLTAFYSYQPVTDTWMPVLNDRSQPLIEQPEEGFGLYYTGELGRKGLEVYLIRKIIRATEGRPIHSLFDTFGSRWTLPLGQGYSLTGEAAYQGGSYGDFDRSAFGGYAHLDLSLPEGSPLPGVLTLGGLFLSGDDPDTENMEGWDPLFSRWPKWSESFIYTLIPEYGGRVAYWSNLASLYSTVNLRLGSAAALLLTYHRLSAHRRRKAEGFFGTGRTRGDLFITKLNLKLTTHLTAHILWERFIPGNYYWEGADRYHWFRIEMMVLF
jgi:hypothetical protein